MAGKRHYKDWYQYESRTTSAYEGTSMAVFTIALVIGFPTMFVLMYQWAIPLLFGLL